MSNILYFTLPANTQLSDKVLIMHFLVQIETFNRYGCQSDGYQVVVGPYEIRKQRQSTSEGIIKKVKGDDAEGRLAKQRQRMANHRACERQAYHVSASDKRYWLTKSSNSSSSDDLLSNCRLLDSHIIHVLPKCAPHYMCTCVLLHSQLREASE